MNPLIQKKFNNYFFVLFYATFVLSMIMYGVLTVDWMDELLALFLVILYGVKLFNDKDWNINRSFLFTIIVFIFYFCYSMVIQSNVLPAIISDTIVQFKPYFAFFATLAIAPKFDKNQQIILRLTAIFVWICLAGLGIASLFKGEELLYTVMFHPVFYSAAIFGVSLVYFLVEEKTAKSSLIFLLMMSLGIISGRSKFFGLFALSVFMLMYFNYLKKFNSPKWKTISFSVLALFFIIFIARTKILYYFGGSITGEIDEESVARFMLYYKAPEILMDYIPFGSGFGSYATYASGVYYSDVYAQYNMDGIWGISKSYYAFIADTYYPALVQFGFAGILLYLFFWVKLFVRSLKYNKRKANDKLLFISLLIIGYFAIEGIADATFSSYRGLFVMMVLGYVTGCLKNASLLTENSGKQQYNSPENVQ